MSLNEKNTLLNGVKTHKLGLGTWFITHKDVAETVRQSVKVCYRLFDTAQAYGNEEGVGEGIRIYGVSRNELFVTSKIASEIKTYTEAKAAIDTMIEKSRL